MTTLDKIMEMKKYGMSEEQISRQLQNEGVYPKEINDSLNQAKIKEATSAPAFYESQNKGFSPLPPVYASNQQYNQQEQTLAPQPIQENYNNQQQNYQEQQNQDYNQNYYQETPQSYSESDYYYPSGIQDTGTISEIAEQVVIEKTENMKSKINELISLDNFMQEKISELDSRLKRIENSIDKLQQSIIEKIGEFGSNSEMIKEDLENLHNSVSKLMNPLIDNINELKKINEKK